VKWGYGKAVVVALGLPRRGVRTQLRLEFLVALSRAEESRDYYYLFGIDRLRPRSTSRSDLESVS